MNTQSRKDCPQNSGKIFVSVLLVLVPSFPWCNGALGLEEAAAQIPIPFANQRLQSRLYLHHSNVEGCLEAWPLFCLTWISGGRSRTHYSWKLQVPQDPQMPRSINGLLYVPTHNLLPIIFIGCSLGCSKTLTVFQSSYILVPCSFWFLFLFCFWCFCGKDESLELPRLPLCCFSCQYVWAGWRKNQWTWRKENWNYWVWREEKGIKRDKQSSMGLLGQHQRNNICIMGIPEEERKEQRDYLKK